ncbi:hypothetical protein TNCV_2349751 [Trichonephila clavipes]|uniref:DUF5641 domain-containing protein n=1 Tax=Trichonephila clavipes TaxID=2585209 RepID=A0A8X6SRF4_TRICX|nr:hypothetical protein TNCV_2349751 [Trichonephila clavipes]
MIEKDNVMCGTMVIVKEDFTPGCNWLLGRVVEVYHGSDGKPQLLLVSRQYRQALKIQQKYSFSSSSPKTASPRSTTEVIPRFSPALPKRPRQHQRQRRAHFAN